MLFLLLFLAAPALAEESVLPEVLVKGKAPALAPRPDRASEFRGESLRVEGPLARALQQSAAVNVRATGGEGTEPLILMRGLDPMQSRVFLEGVPLTEGAFHSAPLSLLPPDAIRKIDLYPEGVPTFLASDGMGGAFHLRTGALDTMKPTVETRAGSFGYLGVTAGAATGNFGGHVSYARSEEDFLYFDDNGTPFEPADDRWLRRQNNGFKRLSLMPRFESGGWKVFSLHSFFDKAFPGSIRFASPGKITQYFTLTGLRYERDDWDLGAFYRRNDEKVDSVPQSLLGFTPSESLGDAVGLRVTRRLGAVEVAAAPAFERYATLTTRAQRWEIPLGISASIPVDRFVFSPAVVGFLYSYDSPSPRTIPFVSPRLGVRADLGGGWTTWTAGGVFSRAPTLVELGGSPAGITPSANLQSETGTRAEVGAEWQTKNLRVAATVSFADLQNLITLIQNSQQLKTAVNIGAARVWSEELALVLKAPWDFTFRNTLTFFQTENRGGILSQNGKPLPHRPTYRGIAGLDWRRGDWGAGYDLSVTGPTQTDLVGDRRLATVFEHGLRAAWYSRSVGEISLEVQNVADVLTVPSAAGAFQTTESNSGFYGYPAPGRRWYLRWKLVL